jgi:hypothetical protein
VRISRVVLRAQEAALEHLEARVASQGQLAKTQAVRLESAAHLPRQHLPRCTGSQDIQDAGQGPLGRGRGLGRGDGPGAFGAAESTVHLIHSRHV